MSPPEFDVYSTCPPSNLHPRDDYLDLVRDIAKWSEQSGCTGILVYTDNGIVDPWLLSDVILDATRTLRPLVAVQPIYMHPYAVAKKIATYAHLHGRAIDLNLLAGGFKNDLVALGDDTPHDDRYVRTTEYARVIRGLVEDPRGTSLDGAYYRVDKLRLTPELADELRPRYLISGSSAAGQQAARDIGATAVCYPKPPAEYESEPPPADLSVGLRVGIIAREESDAAWRLAHERFPPDRKGQLAHQLAMKVSDSKWHEQLSELGGSDSPYWLVPFENYRTFCPYLVGSYGEVAAELAGYLRAGFSTFIMDVPRESDDLVHCGRALRLAAEQT